MASRRRRKEEEIRKEFMQIKKTLRWLKEGKYRIAREDKTKKMVLLGEEMYESFIHKHIEESEAVEIKHDPTLKLARRVGNLVKDPQFLQIWKIAKQEKPTCPRLFAFIKVHKTLVEARPVVEKENLQHTS